MSTSAIIRVCDGNQEKRAIVIWSDGYPEFARDQLLAGIAQVCDGDATVSSFLKAFRQVLSQLYVDAIEGNFSGRPNSVNQFFYVYPTFAAANQANGSCDYQYTVHLVDNKVYY